MWWMMENIGVKKYKFIEFSNISKPGNQFRMRIAAVAMMTMTLTYNLHIAVN